MKQNTISTKKNLRWYMRYLHNKIGFFIVRLVINYGLSGLWDYVKIHLKSSNKPHLFRTSLKALEPELPASTFIHIHKSFILFVESMASVRKNTVF